MLKSHLIQANLEKLRAKAQNEISREGVTAEELTSITNDIKTEEMKLNMQLDIENQERADLEGTVVAPMALGTPEEPKNVLFEEAQDFQNYILGKPNNMVEVKNSLGTGTDSAGGVAVGTVLSGEIIRELKERAGAYSFFNGRSGKGNFETIVISNEAAAEWVAEGGTPSSSTPTTAKVTLKQYRLYKEIELTQQLINASSEEFVSAIVDVVVDAVLDTLEAAIFNGTGTGQPTGIVTSIPVGRKITAAVKGAITLAELKKLKYKIKQGDWGQCAWFMDASAMQVADLLVDGQGRPLLQPNPVNATQFILLGMPVRLTAGMNDVATASKATVVLAHPMAYQTNTQKSMVFDVYNDSAYKKKGMIGLASNIYVDGKRKADHKVAVLVNPA